MFIGIAVLSNNFIIGRIWADDVSVSSMLISGFINEG
jgi:hypothetical protein